MLNPNNFYPFISTPGFNIGVGPGSALIGGVYTSLAQTNLTFAANTTNYVYLDLAAGVVTSNTTGFPGSNAWPIATVVTDNNEVKSLTDNRPDVIVGAGGGSFPLLAPNGSTAAPSYAFAAHPGSGLHDDGVGDVGVGVNGVSQGGWGTGKLVIFNSGILGWGTNLGGGGQDTGLSRVSAGIVAVGNGTAADTTGQLQLGSISKYGGNTLVGNGVPTIVAKYDATAQQANIAGTPFYTIPASGAGTYRLTIYEVVTQAATVSSTLPTAGSLFTDLDTGVRQGSLLAPFGTSTGNTVGTTYQYGVGVFRAAAGSTVTIQTASYASSGATPMQYAIHVMLEYLGN